MPLFNLIQELKFALIFMASKKSKHGGARKGAGRKPKEPTITKRIPISKIEAVNKLIGK